MKGVGRARWGMESRQEINLGVGVFGKDTLIICDT